jgi:hypothetical protein
LNVSRTDFKIAQLLNFIKIRPVGTGLFHADRKTDTKVTTTFCNFANAPKNRLVSVA